jgi:hypothetical protein
MPRPPLTALRQSQLHPQIYLIIQLRTFHSTLMVALLFRVVTQRIGPLTERYSRNNPKSPKVSQDHHRDNIIVS